MGGVHVKFTVAITVWKRQLLLPHAIQSVLAQTYGNWEMRVYSDGRARHARRVVEQLSGEVPITYQRVRRRPRLRGNHLRRLAFEQAEGSHVCIVGHDCVLYPTYLESHAWNLENRPDALSVVPVAYWKDYLRRAPQPVNRDLMCAGEGEIDLLCIAYPRELSLRVGCFGPDMERHRCADFLSFAALREHAEPVLFRGPDQAAHF